MQGLCLLKRLVQQVFVNNVNFNQLVYIYVSFVLHQLQVQSNQKYL